MSNEGKVVPIHIGGKEVKIRCWVEEEYLRSLVEFINQKIDQLKEGKILSSYELIVLVTLKIADEYFTLKQEFEELKKRNLLCIERLEGKIDTLEIKLKELLNNLEELI